MHQPETVQDKGPKMKSYLIFSLMGDEITIEDSEAISESEDDPMKENIESKEDGPRYIIEDDPILGPNIIPSKEEEKRLRRPWRRSLIIKLLGRRIGFNFMRKKIEAI